VPRRQASRRPIRARHRKNFRYTVDASVFVNAFNPHEDGHAGSLEILRAIHQTADPIIVPTLLVPEIAAAVAHASDDTNGAIQYANVTATLPQLMLIPLTGATARHAAELAATHRLRGADSVYLAVARRYGTSLVSRDEQQRTRGAAIVTCLTPEEALAERRSESPAPRQRRRIPRKASGIKK
jgi:predicted nucleic acid-binding protein